MEHTDRAIRQYIALLRDCSALIRSTPALWPLWWAVLGACEAEAARLERILARQRQSLAAALRCEVIDLDKWRRHKAETPGWRRRSAGDAA
jgi:hypothetical protein